MYHNVHVMFRIYDDPLQPHTSKQTNNCEFACLERDRHSRANEQVTALYCSLKNITVGWYYSLEQVRVVVLYRN